MSLASSADEGSDSAFDSECAFCEEDACMSDWLIGQREQVLRHAEIHSSECCRLFVFACSISA